MIDLTECKDRCYADHMGKCGLLNTYVPCNECPFYKPRGCRDWVRVKDKLYAPEEYEERFKEKEKKHIKHPAWTIRTVKE